MFENVTNDAADVEADKQDGAERNTDRDVNVTISGRVSDDGRNCAVAEFEDGTSLVLATGEVNEQFAERSTESTVS